MLVMLSPAINAPPLNAVAVLCDAGATPGSTSYCTAAEDDSYIRR